MPSANPVRKKDSDASRRNHQKNSRPKNSCRTLHSLRRYHRSANSKPKTLETRRKAGNGGRIGRGTNGLRCHFDFASRWRSFLRRFLLNTKLLLLRCLRSSEFQGFWFGFLLSAPPCLRGEFWFSRFRRCRAIPAIPLTRCATRSAGLPWSRGGRERNWPPALRPGTSSPLPQTSRGR